MQTLLILGGTSDIGAATALSFAQAGWNLILAGRNMKNLKRIANDLRIRTRQDCQIVEFEAGKTDPAQFWKSLASKPDGVFCAIGSLGDQEKARNDNDLALSILRDNFTGLVPVLNIAADFFERQGRGFIAAVSSVAGDRGRASNYIYGSAKAGFSAYLSGLRQRLAKKGIPVITVKPGFVDTSMTDDLNLPGLLTATPKEVGNAILNAVKKGKDIVYVKPVWWAIMAMIRAMPEKIFKRLSL